MRILFILQRAGIGGSITSLLNMLELLKQRGVSVDLFVMEHTGVFMDRFHKCANVLPEDKLLASTICENTRVKSYGFLYYIIRCLIYIINRISRKAMLLPRIFQYSANKLKRYDVVIAYQENFVTDFVQYIPAKRRIAWVHTIFERYTAGRTHEELLKMYRRFSCIVCVADASLDAFKKGLPELKERVMMIPNPLNVNYIKEMADKTAAVTFNKSLFNIVSVGRLSPEKQYEYAIKAAHKLKKNGYAFKWYIIGEGAERKKMEILITKMSLEDDIILLGMQSNPYPLIASSDVLVITSLYEAQPMVANEALILDVPVITTNYPSAVALIDDGRNGIICENSVEGIYTTLEHFISNKELQNVLKQGAKSFKYNSDMVMDKAIAIMS